MRRLLPVLLTVASVAAVCVGAVTLAARSHPAAQLRPAAAAPHPAVGSVHVVRVRPKGALSFCSGDVCGVGLSAPVRFTLPAGAAAYDSTVTVSFRYRTAGQATFGLGVDLRKPSGSAVAVAPQDRVLADTARTLASTTLVFHPARLSPGVAYTLMVQPAVRAFTGAARIKVTQLLISLEAWAA
jgi:hypothetical protein